MSPSSEAIVVLPSDLHARPAGKIVQAVAPFDALVEIAYGDKVVNARGVLAVMSLGATAGATVTVRSIGADAAAAVHAVAAVLAEV